MPARVLLVEDTPSMQLIYRAMLTRAGYQVDGASSAQEAEEKLSDLRPDVVLLDLVLPDGDGLGLMQKTLERSPRTKFVVMTADASVDRAVRAMQAGAFDFLVKPFDETRLTQAIAAATAEIPASARSGLDGFVGESPLLRDVFDRANRVATTNVPVFLQGEVGTGKELCARAIHGRSALARGPFIQWKCGAVRDDAPDTLHAALLRADGGTLFLDEICELPDKDQVQLLQVIHAGTIVRHPDARPTAIRLRIMSSSSRDPETAIENNKLRRDLYHRLFVFSINMPSLATLGADVTTIAVHQINQMARYDGITPKPLAADAEKLLSRLSWPGNVRQLSNELRAALLVADGPEITAADLPRQRRPASNRVPDADAPGPTLAELERRAIERELRRASGSVPQAAVALGVVPSTLYRKIARWNAG